MARAHLTSSKPDQAERPEWPPGPKGWPILGNVPELARDQLGFFSSIACQYGDVARFKIGSHSGVLVSDPNLAEQILVKQHGSYRKNSFFWRQVTALFGSGLLTSEGAAWQRQRRMAAPAFVSPTLESYAPIMVDATDEILRTWSSGQVRNVHTDMLSLTMKVASRTLFGCDVEEDTRMMEKDNEALQNEIDSRLSRPFVIPDWVPLPGHMRYLRAIARTDKMVAKIIERRRASPTNDVNLLSRLMLARDETGNPMSDRQLRDEVVTFLLAGQETTALALSWTWYLLGQYPDVDAKLGLELRKVLGARAPHVGDITQLPYTQHVITEAMRLYPPAWIVGRETAETCKIGKYTIPPGATVFISPWVLHRSSRFFDEPAAFKPERWAGTLSRDLPRFAYMPFGGGPRICIGQRFAIMEACLILATIAQKFSVEWLSDRPVIPQPSITLRPKHGVWVRLSARRQLTNSSLH